MDIPQLYRRLSHFFKHDLWRMPLQNLSGGTQFVIRQMRIVLLAVRGFSEDNLSLRASSLTMYTLLSVVPLAAMAFGIAKGFGFETVLEEVLRSNFTGQEAVVEQIITFSHNLLDSTKGELIAGIGFGVLLVTVLTIFSSIEESFNAIYDVKQSRTWLRRFSDYLTMMIIAPLLFILASSLTVYVSAFLSTVAEEAPLSGAISPVVTLIIQILPFLLIGILFTMLYVVMPNTKVQFKSALTAGIIAGVAFTAIQWGYLYFQIGVSRYNAIYGSFAALPLFIIWLQISWLIVLIGAEIAYANQNVENFESETDISGISPRHQQFITVVVMHRIVKSFEAGLNPPSTRRLSIDLGLPLRLIRKSVSDLMDAGLVHELQHSEKTERSFIPTYDIQQINIGNVLKALESTGSQRIQPKADQTISAIRDALDRFRQLADESDQNRKLVDIDIKPRF